MFAFWGFDLSWDDSQRELGGTKCFASSVWRASCSLCRKKLSPNLNDSLFRDLFIPFFRPGLWCCCFFSYLMITFISYTRNSEFREYFGGWVIKVFFFTPFASPSQILFHWKKSRKHLGNTSATNTTSSSSSSSTHVNAEVLNNSYFLYSRCWNRLDFIDIGFYIESIN